MTGSTSVRIADFRVAQESGYVKNETGISRLAWESSPARNILGASLHGHSVHNVLHTDPALCGPCYPCPPPNQGPRSTGSKPAPPFIPSEVTSLTVGNHNWPDSAGPQRAGSRRAPLRSQKESHRPAIGAAWLMTGTVERCACCRLGRTSRLNFGLG